MEQGLEKKTLTRIGKRKQIEKLFGCYVFRLYILEFFLLEIIKKNDAAWNVSITGASFPHIQKSYEN